MRLGHSCFVLEVMAGGVSITCAKTSSMAAGDGSIACPQTMDELSELKACENDNDYTFLLRQLCNDGHMPTGPYTKETSVIKWHRANSKRVVHTPPTDNGKYD